MAIAKQVIEMYLGPELPELEPVGLSTTSNASVRGKLAYVRSIPELTGRLLPDELNNPDLDLSDEALAIAPWVNAVHTMIRIFNMTRSIRGMQIDGHFDPKIAVAISKELIEKTTEHSGKSHLRRDSSSHPNIEYTETKMRRYGTLFLNPNRYVTHKDMLALLNVVRQAFAEN